MQTIAISMILAFAINHLHVSQLDCSKNIDFSHPYDSIKTEMIKTICDIENIEYTIIDNKIELIQQNEKDSMLQIQKFVETLITSSNNTKFSNNNIELNDHLARVMRANFMGQLLIQNYRNEEKILSRFSIHRKGLDSLITYFGKIINSPSTEVLQEDLIPNENENSNNIETRNNSFFRQKTYIIISIVILISLLIILITLYIFFKKKRINLFSVNHHHKNPKKQNSENDIKIFTQNDSIESINIHETNNLIGKTRKEQLQQDTKILIPQQNNLPQDECIIDTKNRNAFGVRNDNCIVVGASIIGMSHISMKLPCQDNCRYAYLEKGWGIAITSDGAGSAEHSEIGSRIVVERGIHYFRSVIEQKNWIKKGVLPTEAEWNNIAFTTLKAIKTDMEKFSQNKQIDLSSLNATIIVIIHSPIGFLTTHIGDGRAGYKDDSNEWKSLITPHKGEEANQTIFITSDFWNIPYFVLSGVMVPESHVIRCKPIAFTLLSDGCEHAAWQCNIKNETTSTYYDPNKPYARFFDPLISKLSKNATTNLKTSWIRFLTSGNSSFEKESDDKTMILGVLTQK